MKFLVTGATGFLGARLCRVLIEKGHHVKALHRRCSPLHLLGDLPVELVEGDVTQPETLEPAVQAIDGIYHLAAMRGMGTKQPERMHAVTVIGTRNLLKAAFEAGVKRVVYTSSVASLGVPESSASTRDVAVVLNESHTWNFDPNKWFYGYAKYLAEKEVQRIVAQGMDVVIVNPTVIMGGGDINNQIGSPVILVSQSRLPIQIEGGINIIHVADVIEGHLAAMERGKTGERYILGGYNLSMSRLAHNIAKVTGTPPPFLTVPAGVLHRLAGALNWFQPFISMPFDTEELYLAGYNFYYDTRKAQSYLGFLPAHTVEDAIWEAYQWFQEVGTLPAEKQKY